MQLMHVGKATLTDYLSFFTILFNQSSQVFFRCTLIVGLKMCTGPKAIGFASTSSLFSIIPKGTGF